ncbi:MAG TPA: alpha/beta hydrolase [Oligoflexus sp.]|uniref:alpha/beta hydrolase n=1 Tax=Oligoflexus sp. TaxID=1971216 RepID=UPI002D807026|nr:alpha/beta hydrolase [Oligoflexus sp.]HET9238242.1 alpha/beta hydrolase [Oligoflexus sp.]
MKAVRFMGLIMAPFLGACNGAFYYPVQEDLYDPRKMGFQLSDERIPSTDDVLLAAFWFKALTAEPRKKLIIHFHGNAENMTSHFMFTAWLSEKGFDVLTFDYRGYGRSTATPPTREGLVEDGCAVFRWVAQHPVLKTYEVHVIGQSIGGAVAIASLAHCPELPVQSLIIDSSFSSYRRIARQKLGGFFLTWPLQYPLSFLVTDDWSPIDGIAKLSMKMLFLHNPHDPVVPYKLGRELYEKAVAPKTWMDVSIEGHTSAIADPESPYRLHVLEFLR